MKISSLIYSPGITRNSNKKNCELGILVIIANKIVFLYFYKILTYFKTIIMLASLNIYIM